MAYNLVNPDWAIRSFVAGEALSAGNAVYIHSDGTVRKANASAGTANVSHGFVLKDVASGKQVDVVRAGVINGFSGLTVGGLVYLGKTAGAVTQTAPATTGDRVQVLGVAIAADTVLVCVMMPGTIV